MHLTLGILRTSQAVSHALAFFWLDGFAVPAPAQVTQTVRRLPSCHFCRLAILLHFDKADRPFSLTCNLPRSNMTNRQVGHRPRLRRVRPASSRPGGSDADGAVLVRQRQAFFRIDDDAGSPPAATPDRSRRRDRSPVRFPEWRDDWRVGIGQVLGADIRKGANTPCHWWRADATSPLGQGDAQAFLEATQTGSDTRTDALPRPRATPTRLDQDPTPEAGQTPQAGSDAERRRTKRAPAARHRCPSEPAGL